MKASSYVLEITAEQVGQRLDNFLISLLKGVPKTHIYRLVRKGEVRVNKGRIEVSYRLALGDNVRIPPVRVAEKTDIPTPIALTALLETQILYEDEALLVLNKPSGFAVHGGSGEQAGVIEGLRHLRPQAKFLELAHRLDKETSGCLIIAKKRIALNHLHEQFRDGTVEKTYLALLAGCWERKKLVVNAPLLKREGKNGERIVTIHPSGKTAETLFRRMQRFQAATLVEASPKTGRTHQIRVHAASLGHPIVGDERYGDADTNWQFKKRGYSRLFLHAQKLNFIHPVTNNTLFMQAPLPQLLLDLLAQEKT